jgi:membrane fusion protein, copper/silver efflux system
MRTAFTWCAGLLCGAVAVAVLPASWLFVPTQAIAVASGERWACAMLDYIGTGPGSCPVCGMDLERVDAGAISREHARRMGLETVIASRGPATAVVVASGQADYDDRKSVRMTARISGRIVRRHEATWGCCEVVAAGDPVVDLDSPEAYQAQVQLREALRLGDDAATAAIAARFARWDLVPVADAIRAGGEPQQIVTLAAPVDGQVLLANLGAMAETLQVGRQIADGDELVRLVDPDALIVSVRVPERQVWMLSEGAPVAIATDDRGRISGLNARLDRIGAEIDPMSRSVEARIYLRGARDRVRPGSLVTATIQAALDGEGRAADPGQPASWGSFVRIPQAAVLSTGIRHLAWKVASTRPDGSRRFVPVPLDLGPRLTSAAGDDWVVVRAGLAAGDEVAAQGAFLVDAQAQLAGTPSLLFPTGAP